MDLKGKNILVTGGGGFGVGEGICKVLTDMGANLVINEKNTEKALEVALKYTQALPIAADISDAKEVENMFRIIKQKVGVLHGLVNNAGIGLCKPAHESSVEEFDGLYNVDIKGMWMVSRIFVNQLLENKIAGSIVNVSSVHARSTIPGYALYASAKSAVEGLTRGMAVELGKYQIRVNAIAPGYVHAEQNYPLLRAFTPDPEKWVEEYIIKEQVIHQMIQPEDCGHPVAFLLSDLSRSVTGQTLYIDNGTTIKLLGTA